MRMIKTAKLEENPMVLVLGFFFSLLIGEKLLYNVVLVSVIQQWKPIIITYPFPPGGSMVRNPPVNAGAWVQSLGQEDPLEKETVQGFKVTRDPANHFNRQLQRDGIT